MKKTIKIIALLSLSISATALMAEDNQAKKYPIETGKISYEIKGSGDVMGMVKTETIGKKRIIFNNFGMNELTEENEIEKTTQGGKTKIKKHHTLKHVKGSIIYSVKFDDKRIMRLKNPAAGAMGQLFGGGSGDMAAEGEAMLKKMGGKKTGSDEVAGQKCDIWELMGTIQCIYKGIPLRVVTNVMGIKTTEVATKVEFGIDVTKEDFKLPDYPVFNMDMDDLTAGKMPKELDKNKLDEMDKKAEAQANKESKDMQEGFKAMTEAAEKAGIKKGEKATKNQQEAMMKNLQNAIFPKMKKQILQEAEMMNFGAKCLGVAETLADANNCTKEANEKFPSDDGLNGFDEWNPQIKQEALSEASQFGKAQDCIKASKNMGELQKCMPEEQR